MFYEPRVGLKNPENVDYLSFLPYELARLLRGKLSKARN